MKKILFFIPNLCGGGAERVLVNLCNNITDRYDVTVLTLYNEGVYRTSLNPKVKYKSIFNVKIKGLRIMLKFIPLSLFKFFIKGKYDICISYLEGITTRILANDNNSKIKIAWVHSKVSSEDIMSVYKSNKEFENTYQKYDRIVFVSNETKENFERLTRKLNLRIDEKKFRVLNNINESEKIILLSKEEFCLDLDSNKINCAVVGKIAKSKGVFRIINILIRNNDLRKKYKIFYVGVGPDLDNAKKLVKQYNIDDCVEFLGYQANPYKIMSRMDLIICPSYTEGLSTVITESLILGKAILTTDCGGMRELLLDSKYGYIVSNDEVGLEKGLNFYTEKDQLNYFSKKSLERSKKYLREKIVRETIEMFEELI